MWKIILDMLEGEMATPKPYGCFHLTCLVIMIAVIILLFCINKKEDEKQLKNVLGIYGITAFILELLKQIIWSVEYNSLTNSFVWDYQWYAFPFQLCTMPIYVCLPCLFLKKGILRDALLSFVAYTTILGSIASAIIPDTLFVPEILVNIHTMWLHLGSLVVSIYLVIAKHVKINFKQLFEAIIVFVVCVLLANILNILVYNSGILDGETFNMFYISPYFKSTLPIFDLIYEKVPYLLFLITYILALSMGSYIIFGIECIISKIVKLNKG